MINAVNTEYITLSLTYVQCSHKFITKNNTLYVIEWYLPSYSVEENRRASSKGFYQRNITANWQNGYRTGKTGKTGKTDKTDKTDKTGRMGRTGRMSRMGRMGRMGRTNRTNVPSYIIYICHTIEMTPIHVLFHPFRKDQKRIRKN